MNAEEKGARLNELEIVRLKNAIYERDQASGSQTAPDTLLEWHNNMPRYRMPWGLQRSNATLKVSEDALKN